MNGTNERRREEERKPDQYQSPLGGLDDPGSRQLLLSIRAHQNFHKNELLTELKELTKTTKGLSSRLSAIDQRLDRLEVTANKTFVLVGDITSKDTHKPKELKMDDESCENFDVPSFPIRNMSKLTIIHKKLKDNGFRDFLVAFRQSESDS